MNVVGFVISFGIFIFSLWLFGVAFEYPDYSALIFSGGIIATSIAMAIPFHLLGHSEQK